MVPRTSLEGFITLKKWGSEADFEPNGIKPMIFGAWTSQDLSSQPKRGIFNLAKNKDIKSCHLVSKMAASWLASARTAASAKPGPTGVGQSNQITTKSPALNVINIVFIGISDRRYYWHKLKSQFYVLWISESNISFFQIWWSKRRYLSHFYPNPAGNKPVEVLAIHVGI